MTESCGNDTGDNARQLEGRTLYMHLHIGFVNSNNNEYYLTVHLQVGHTPIIIIMSMRHFKGLHHSTIATSVL